MQTLKIGDVTVTSIIERDGPWRRPEDMFPAYDPEVGRRHIAKLDPFVFDVASGRMVITYQTFIVRTPKRTILVDTCTGEDKGYPPPMDFPKQPWLDGFRAGGLRFEDIDYVFCTHLHIDHCGWNTLLRNGRWVPTFPKDFQLDDTLWLTPTPGHSPCHCCVNIRSGGQRAVVIGDLMHHALQCREPDWSTIFDWDRDQAARSRRRFLGEIAGTGTFVMPVHFPHPTAGLVEADGDRFHYKFVR